MSEIRNFFALVYISTKMNIFLRSMEQKRINPLLCAVYLFILLISPLFANPGEYLIEHINTQNGLSNNYVHCIAQDKSGFLWIGTENGLNRYDGYEMRVYLNDPNEPGSIAGNFIRTLLVDTSENENSIWVGTRGNGLCKLRVDSVFAIKYKKIIGDSTSLCDNNINVLYMDRQGVLWIGTEGGGLNKYDKTNDSFKTYKHDPNDPTSINHGWIMSIYEDQSEKLWIGNARYGGLSLFDRKSEKFVHFVSDSKDHNTIPGNGVYTMFEDYNGVFWLGTSNGLCKFDRITKTFNRHQFLNGNITQLESSMIWRIYEDCNHNLFVANVKDGFIKISPDRKSYKIYQFLPNTYPPKPIGNISCFYTDRSGILWIGTFGNGLYKLIPMNKDFKIIDLNSDIYEEDCDFWITSLFESKNGDIWVGTVNLLYQLNLETLKLKPIHLGKINGIAHIDQADNGKIWIARGISLTCFDPATLQFTNYYGKYDFERDFIPSDRSSFRRSDINFSGGLTHISIDRKNTVWCLIGSFQQKRKVIKFDPESNNLVFYPDNDSPIQQIGIELIFLDDDKQIYLGTKDGKIIIEDTTLVEFETGEKSDIIFLSPDTSNESVYRIYSILKDGNKNLWIGTDHGLYQYESGIKVIRHFDEKDGLPSNIVLGLLEDNNKNIWFSTDRGLARISIISKEIHKINIHPGPKTFTRGAFCKTRDGLLMFGTSNGILYFHPDSIKNNVTVPPVVITDLLLYNKSYNYIRSYNSDALNIPLINLNYDQSVLTFKFSVLDFTDPGKNQYIYKMEGIDREWVKREASARNVTYSKLPPGKYQFTVKGSDSEGNWNNTGAFVNIMIHPPWWQTRWAYIFYFIFFMALIMGIIYSEKMRQKRKYKMKVEQERQKSRLMEATLKAKTLEAEKEIEKQQIRSRIASDLHDEIGSNLSSIALTSHILENKLSGQPQYKSRLKDLESLAIQSAEAIRDIVWFINPENDSFEKLINKMRHLTAQMLTEMQYKFDIGEMDITESTISLEIRRNLFLIYKEILNNIIRHAQAKNVHISLTKDKTCFVLKVEDDGVGFDPEKADGNGLKNFRKRAQAMHGSVKIDSKTDQRTQIIITAKIP